MSSTTGRPRRLSRLKSTKVLGFSNSKTSRKTPQSCLNVGRSAERQSKSTKNRFEPGDVLYGKLRPYLNKVIDRRSTGFCTTEIIPLKANAALDGRYLFYSAETSGCFSTYVGNVSHGLIMPRLGTMRAGPRLFSSLRSPSRSESRTSWRRCWGGWTPAAPASTASPTSSNASANPSSPPPPPASSPRSGVKRRIPECRRLHSELATSVAEMLETHPRVPPWQDIDRTSDIRFRRSRNLWERDKQRLRCYSDQ